MLLAKGYPDIGWNPCGGERYLDFLRFAVFVNGEAGVVEEDLGSLAKASLRVTIHALGQGLGANRNLALLLEALGPGAVWGTPGSGSQALLTLSRWPGESVEENANVVVRLLIRKPECFGPALRGEGGSGLLAAIEEAIRISEDPGRDGPGVRRDRRREQ
jgi:hypothetical protein